VTALRKDGGDLPIELSLTMWTEPGTDRPAGFAAIMRDITNRRKLEEERNAYALRLEEQMAAIEATNDGIAITDAEGRFIFMNSAHARLFGYAAPEDAAGIHWSKLYDATEAERITSEAMPAVAAQGSWRGQAFGRHRDGHLIEQEVTLSAGANGGLVCTTRNIGERQRSLRERIRTRAQLLLAERQEMIGRVVSGMAHDFNNMMAVITASAAALEQDGGADGAQVHRIQSAATAAGKLLRKILRPERRVAERQPMDLSRVIREVAELIEVSLRPGHAVAVELPAEAISIDADESEFMQVLMNLCTNARDALPADRPGQITLSYREGNGRDFDGAPRSGYAEWPLRDRPGGG
jgi:PAS domain S-box-containing protein